MTPVPNLRLQDMSIYYWLVDTVPSAVNVVDAFPVSDVDQNPRLVLPTVSIDTLPTSSGPFELGNKTPLWDRQWVIDIFANTKSMRDDLGYMILEALYCDIVVSDYNEGFPPDVTPTEVGALLVRDIEMQSVYVFRELVEDLYWRASVTFFTKYNAF